MLEVECPLIPPPPCAQKILSAAVFGGGVDGDAAGVGEFEPPKAAAAATVEPKLPVAGEKKQKKRGDAAAVGASECDRPKAAAMATVESKKPVKGNAGEKKRVTVGTRMRPFPVLTEEQLAWFKDPVEREEWRELMSRGAKLYYGSSSDRLSMDGGSTYLVSSCFYRWINLLGTTPCYYYALVALVVNLLCFGLYVWYLG
jgi:hypothetical protein